MIANRRVCQIHWCTSVPSWNCCNVYHLKTSIPCRQILRFNRICSKNQFFDKTCNALEVWLKSCGYNKKLVRQQILKARKCRRTERLYRQRAEVHKHSFTGFLFSWDKHSDFWCLTYFSWTSWNYSWKHKQMLRSKARRCSVVR